MNSSRISKDMRDKALKLTAAVYRVTREIPKNDGLRFKIREKAGETLGDIIEYGYLPEEKKALAVFAKIEAIKSYFEIARASGFVKPVNCAVLFREYEALAEFFSKELMVKNRKFSTSANDNLEVSPRLGRGETSMNTPQAQHEVRPLTKVEVSSPAPAGGETSTNKGNSSIPRPPAGMAVPKPSGRDGGSTSLATEGLATSSENIYPNNGALNSRQQAILTHLREAGEAKLSDFFDTLRGVSSKTIQRDLQDLMIKNILKKNGERRWTSYRIV